jgi:hypothetical protein
LLLIAKNVIVKDEKGTAEESLLYIEVNTPKSKQNIKREKNKESKQSPNKEKEIRRKYPN